MSKLKHKIDLGIEKFLVILETVIAIGATAVLVILLLVQFG